MNAPARPLHGQWLASAQPGPASAERATPAPRAPTAVAHTWPRLSPALLDPVRVAYGRMGPARVDFLGLPHDLHWVCPPLQAVVAWTARLHTSSGTVTLGFDTEGLFPFWPGTDFPIHAELLAAHLVEEFAPALRALEACLDVPLTGVQLNRGRKTVEPALSLRVSCPDAGREGTLHILEWPAGLDFHRLLGHPFPAAQARPADAAWPMLLRFSLGSTRISLRELRGLDRGDILAVESWMARNDMLRLEGFLEHESQPSMVLWAGERSATVDQIQHRGTPMPVEISPSLGFAPRSLDDLELTVSFDLGERKVPLGELHSLQPGYVFELDAALNRAPVRVVVNGTAIAVGQLVAVGERLGVRIVDISKDARGEQLS